MRRRVVLLLCTAGLIISAQPKVFAQSGISAELKSALERVEGMTTAELTRDKLGSVSVGIVFGADLIWAKSFGLANIENKIPATIESVYRIGSITKQFTGLMLLQLVDEQKVHLADPVEKHFPEISSVPGLSVRILEEVARAKTVRPAQH
jgi:CubicO group peptidase (beta-lactamase class C family)